MIEETRAAALRVRDSPRGRGQQFPDVLDIGSSASSGASVINVPVYFVSMNNFSRRAAVDSSSAPWTKSTDHLMKAFERADCPHRKPLFLDRNFDRVPDRSALLTASSLRACRSSFADAPSGELMIRRR